MNVYLFIDRRKKSVDVHGEYAQLLREGCETADTLAEADVVHLLGAWSFKAARIARRARRMGIPYMVTPLGAVSPWNRTHPRWRRLLQTWLYEKRMLTRAHTLIATSEMERSYLLGLKWNPQVFHIANSLLTRTIAPAGMVQLNRQAAGHSLELFEQARTEAVTRATAFVDDMTFGEAESGQTWPNEREIVGQIMRIHLRMAHRNIPDTYIDRLNSLLNHTEYNDDIVAEALHRLGLTRFARSLFGVMATVTGLTEGFMPLPALSSRQGKTIGRYIKKDTTNKNSTDHT